MVPNRRMSRVLDERRIAALAASVAHEPSDVGVMLLDRDLRIRGANTTYEAVSMRRRDEMLDDFIFDVFPDNPNDPQASGSSELLVSIESALRRRGTDTMPIFRYDISDSQNPDVFLPKLWSCSSTSVDDGDEQIQPIPGWCMDGSIKVTVRDRSRHRGAEQGEDRGRDR